MAITDNMVINQTLTIKNLAKVSKELLFMLFLLALVLVLKPVKANAATLDVVTGSSAISADGSCQLEEALQNINDGASTNTDCVNTGAAYGTNDTINLPEGTITGPGSGLRSVYGASLKVIGQGRDKSIIENGRFHLSGSGLATSTALFKDFKMTGSDSGMSVSEYGAVEIDGLELDGEGFGGSGTDTIVSTYNVDDVVIKNTRVHGFKYDTSGSGYDTYTAIGVTAYDGQQTQLRIDGVTVDNCNAGIFMQSAGGGDPDGSGFSTDASQIDASITNSTLTNILNSGGIAAGLGAMAAGDSTING